MKISDGCLCVVYITCVVHMHIACVVHINLSPKVDIKQFDINRRQIDKINQLTGEAITIKEIVQLYTYTVHVLLNTNVRVKQLDESIGEIKSANFEI